LANRFHREYTKQRWKHIPKFAMMLLDTLLTFVQELAVLMESTAALVVPHQ
jgi:hypothetical protein